MKKENLVKDKSFEFSLETIRVCRILIEVKKEYILSKQLLRSGTSIGAAIRESERAESKKDFIHKLSIAQKEANESQYWIELLIQSKYLQSSELRRLNNQCQTLNKLLGKILITLRTKYISK